MKKIYLVVGVPGSGKTTQVCEKLKDHFEHVAHDDYSESHYPDALLRAALFGDGDKPVVGEIPFGLSKIQGQLEKAGVEVEPVFILENEHELGKRWEERGTKESARAGHLKRQHTYRERAQQLGAFTGTADQVRTHLSKLVGK